jgi:dienelactone hydrolase
MQTSLMLLLLALQAASPRPASDDVRNRETPDTDTHVVMATFEDRAAWEAHRAAVRQRILLAAGLDPLPARTPLSPQRWGRIERDGYTVEKVVLETWPGFFLAGNLFVPAGPGPHPAVVSPHGHWTYGRLEHGVNGSIPSRAQQLARHGHVVFIYDMVGYADTTQIPHGFTGAREHLWAFGPLGLQLWNSLRVVDYLESLPEVDRTRIGATGASGGATQVFLLAAIDERVAYAAPVNMVSAYMQGGSMCENAPGLRHGISNLDIASAIAPRPTLIVSATGDWTRHAPAEEVPAIRKIWALYGAEAQLTDVQFDAPHNYNQQSREAVYQFLNAQAFARPAAVKEARVRIEPLPDMLAWHGRARPASALGYDALFASWRDAARAQAEATTDVAELRRRIAGVAAARWPDRVAHDGGGVLSRGGVGDRVATWYQGGRGVPVVAVHPDGLEAGRTLPEVRQALQAGRPVLVVEAFQTGGSVTARARGHNHFLTFNVSDDQARIQDLVTATRWVQTETRQSSVDLVAADHARYWAAVAAAVAPAGVVRLVRADGDLGGDDESLARWCLVPGLQRVGGLAAVRRVLGSGL